MTGKHDLYDYIYHIFNAFRFILEKVENHLDIDDISVYNSV